MIKTSKIFGFIYARSDSTRLPNKALLPLAGVPMISVILQRASRFCEPVLLTSDRAIDLPIVNVASSLGYKVIKGDAHNLVSRTILAIEVTGADFFIRINGDSPFVDTLLLSRLLKKISLSFDITTNLIQRSFPYGVAVEIISSAIYKKLAKSCYTEELEHVTQHLYRQKKLLNFASVISKTDYQEYKMTIDTPEDYHLIKNMFVNVESVINLNWWDVIGSRIPLHVSVFSSNGSELKFD